MTGVGTEEATLWHTLEAPEVARRLQVNSEDGLTAAEVDRRLAQYGTNELMQARSRSLWAIFVAQFKSLIVALLLAATVVAFALEETIEAVAILFVILLNAVIGFFTEWGAETSLAALRKQLVAVAHVIRGGEEREVPAWELVPGDLVILSAGTKVPADGRIIESVQLRVDEAALTGESHAVEKIEEPILDADATLGDRRNMVYMGTIITDGRAQMLVTGTGPYTEMGRIGTMIEEAMDETTPLERKLDQLGRTSIFLVLTLCAVIVLAGWWRGIRFLYMLEVGISLAIAAVPEGLPAVATMTLAIGMRRMARLQALIRRLPAVETLGSTTVICTDKTGTLTKNEMTVKALWLEDRYIEVGGSGYAVEGDFRIDGRILDPRRAELLLLALRIGSLCTDAGIDRDGRKQPRVLGDPTEAALLIVAEKAGLLHDDLEERYPRLDEIPFSSQTRRMVTVHRTPEGKPVAYVKGAPKTILATSSHQLAVDGPQPLTDQHRERFLAANDKLAHRALRVLAVAYRTLSENYNAEQFTQDLVFVGLVGMMDPLREEAKNAIATCREAGIRTVMITGDQRATAAEIARQLGLDRDLQGRPLETVHGRDLVNMDEAGWRNIVEHTAVFARVSPEHKLKIVTALQQRGEIVAMTGDGVNDAPALKKADIGVAMGIKGTEVAKESADMVITDDNFATIVHAVEQGRIIYANILRFIHYLFSCNISGILTIFIAIMIGWPLPLAALQILWLNMITDVFPALALALEPSAPDMMKRRPRNPRRPLMSWSFLGLLAWQGSLLAGVTLLAFLVSLNWYGREDPGRLHAVTLAFMTLALARTFHSFNARSQRRSTFDKRFFTNGWLWGAVGMCILLQLAAVYVPLLQTVLHTTPLTLTDWAVVLGCSLLPIAVVEIVKLVQAPPEIGFDPERHPLREQRT